MAAAKINIDEFKEFSHFPLKKGWEMVIDPRRFRAKAGILCKANIICVLRDIIARLTIREAAILALFFCGVAHESIQDCLSSDEAPEITTLLIYIKYIFENLGDYTIEPAAALAVLDVIYQHIDDEDFIMQKFGFSSDQACALTYFCKVLSPEEVI